MLETLNLKKKLSKTAYHKAMDDLQTRLRKLQYRMRDAGIPVIICLEGWDTAGKGEAIRRLTEKLDPRLFRVHSGRPPTPLEQRYHFLWRYQTVLPNYGEMAVFDHSWYGRVLVERCDKLVSRKEWGKAYQQINELERWLTDDGHVLIKVWLHISKKEQRKRFRKCLADSNLRWKITREYRRHHKEYGRWTEAVEEMLGKTDTAHAPWSLIEANDGKWARVRLFELLVQQMEAALRARGEAAETFSVQAKKSSSRGKTNRSKALAVKGPPTNGGGGRVEAMKAKVAHA